MSSIEMTTDQFGEKRRNITSNNESDVPWQYDEILKPRYMNIIDNDLKHAYSVDHPGANKGDLDTSSKKIIIVGAGISGLAAAYELEKVGFETLILEMQHRIGGRVKTIREGFANGLQEEGGAMRIPVGHYMTHAYVNKFNIQLREFVSHNDRAYIYIDKHKPIRVKEWNVKNAFYSNKFFPSWDQNIREDLRPHVEGINDYYTRTIQEIKDDLQSLGWDKWIEKWDRYSMNSFLREPDSVGYRPWSEIAIEGLELSTYAKWLDISIIEFLRADLADWRVTCHYPVMGMSAIPEGFATANNDNLWNKTQFGIKVENIQKNGSGVLVTGRNVTTGIEQRFECDAVIVTIPLTLLRQIDVDLEPDVRRVISACQADPTSKVFLQCSSRFWEDDVGYGGFTVTDLQIGQIKYPNKNDPKSPNQRGILACYIHGDKALSYGSQSEKEAVASAVKQISEVHPDIDKYFEVGKLQAWYKDPSAQCAFSKILPGQVTHIIKSLMKARHPIYLAGDAISYSNGWIQGALESGLRAAFQLYSHYQEERDEKHGN